MRVRIVTICPWVLRSLSVFGRKPIVMIRRAVLFLDLIRFEHAVFALPLAYLGVLLAARGSSSRHDIAWIGVVMTAARTRRVPAPSSSSLVPAPYSRPRTVDEVATGTFGRAPLRLGLDNPAYTRGLGPA